jgi:endonuclease/exonuclease/phosphatase family metal-dependent hydrolase
MSRRSRNPSQRIRVLTYNIHQGMTVFRRHITLSLLKEAIKSLKVDIVLLQEVAGVQGQRKRKERLSEAVTPFQLEALADKLWPYTAYGKNSVFSGGFHGNAVLSRFPIRSFNNTDLSLVKGLVRRGLLHAEIEWEGLPSRLHVVSTHLGLLEAERSRQTKRLIGYFKDRVPSTDAVIMGGDFNDWRERISPRLAKHCRFDEAFLKQGRKHARTFPAQMPLLKLDRIYYRGLKLVRASQVNGRPWQFLSDHLPLVAEFQLP